jgi:hypothetical protein
LRSRFVLFAAVLAFAACTAGPALAAAHMLIGLQDDAQFVSGDPDKAFPLVKTLRVQVVRVNMLWSAVARTKPVHPQDPSDPAYNWGPYDRAVLYATQERAKVLFTVLGTPAWARGPGSTHAPPGPNTVPKAPLDLQKFAYAAAKRYSGSFRLPDGRLMPPVRFWMAWNEPNDPAFLFPQYIRKSGKWFMQSPVDYVKICNAVYKGVHGTLIAGEKVSCGGTSPRGNNNPNAFRPSIDPLSFMRALKTDGLRQFDVYSHHPYYQQPNQPPGAAPTTPNTVTLGNINTLIAQLTRLWGKKRLWITEYGYQTNPPDRVFGVTYAKQAAYLTQAFAIARKNPRIDMMVWFLLRDEKAVGTGWQSGLMTLAGKRKPAFTAFAKLPH